MTKRRSAFVCLLAFALLWPAFTRAEHTRYWRESDFAEFEDGTANGIAIRSDGMLAPAPRFSSFADPNLAYIWALRLDSHGRLYAAGGSDAKVLRIDDTGNQTTVFEATELAAQAIAFDSADNLYVGTSPDGKVYKVTPSGQKSVFFEPKTKYIWALALDPQGDLFVATGDTGEVFAVGPDGKGKLFYQSQERHARSLAFDSKGNLLIGTEPDGLILRVEISRKSPRGAPDAGPTFVLYETEKAEVTSLIEDANGNLFAASVGEKVRSQGAPRVTVTAPPSTQPAAPASNSQGTVTIVQAAPSSSPQQSTVFPFPSTETGGAVVVKIAADGSPDILWRSGSDIIFSLGLSSVGKVLLGTGEQGSIIELEGNEVFSTIAKTSSAQVTSLVAGAGGRIFVATANPGKVFTLGPGYEPDGSFVSQTFDAKIFSRWGRISWGNSNEPQGKIALYVRSGNTSNPENNWSPWSGPYSNSGDQVSCPSARFIQWKAVLSNSPEAQPAISWVSLAYLPKNVPPVIDDIALQDPGIRLMGFSSSGSGPGSASPVPIRTPHGPGATSSPPPVADISSSPKMEVAPQGYRERGYQSVYWNAHDANDDDLIYSIYYRGADEKTWRLLKDKLTQRFYAWDTTSIPDGSYYLKITASDSPSNPPEQSLSSERESDRFEISNAPPRIEGLRSEITSSAVNVSFEGISSSGAIARAQYDVDAGDWQIVFPVGLLSDAPKENYRIGLADLAPGEHTVTVQITDPFGNVASGKVIFTIPAKSPK